MTTATMQVEKPYGGDLAELFNNPGALVAAVIGTLLVCALGSLLMLTMSQDCVATFEKSWRAQGREVLSDAFKAAVVVECDVDADDKCIQGVRATWAKDEMNFYSLEYGLAVSEACPAETKEDEYEIDFEPGALVKLGVEIEEKEIPEKIIIQETRAEEETAAETVTEDEKAKPAEEPPPKVEEKPKKKPTKKPVEKKDNKLPTSKIPTKKNTPFNDLPTKIIPKGDPFGDPGGWSDLKKDGDPWATAVMKALNNLEVGAFAAKGEKGIFKFQLTLCKDGRISRVNKKGGSLSGQGQSAVLLALQQLKLPKPPAKVKKRMKKPCAKIKYTFVYRNGGVR